MRIFRSILAVTFVLSIFLYAHFPVAFATTGINKQINFQGKVTSKTAGTNVANASYSFTFSLYTASLGGVAVWTETKSLTVTNGIFTTMLGDTTTLPGSVDFNTDNLYLGIVFNGDSEMTPRMRLAAAPYALNALKVAGLTVTDTTGTLTIANSKTISYADAFTMSGAFPLTLTTAASTNVTFPTTGTILSLAGIETLTNKTIGAGGLAFQNSESIINSSDGIVTLVRNTTGTVTLNAADNDSTAALTILSGGAATLTLDAGGAAAVTVGTSNADAIAIGNSTSFTSTTFDKGSSGNFVFRSNSAVMSCAGNTSSGAVSLNASGQLICTDDDSGGGGLVWNSIGDATAGGSIVMAEYAQTLDWNTATTATSFDGLKITITNDAGTDATTQRAFVVQNINDGIATGTTETLLALDNADVNEAVTQGLLITSSGSGGMTYGINLDDTDIATDLSLQFGETIDNNTDGTIALTVAASGLTNILTGNLQVGNGTPTLTLDGEDAYIEDIFEVDGVSTFGSNVGVGITNPTATFHLVTTQAHPDGFKYVGNVADLTHSLNNTSAGGRNYQLISAGTSSTVVGAFRFYDSTASLDRMTIASSGNVGIGSTVPTTLLDVNGEIKGTSFSGSGLADCDSSGSKIIWDATAKTFSCGADRASYYSLKTADQSATSNITLANVTEMSFPIGANENWIFQMYIIGTSATTPDFKFSVTAPASSSCGFTIGSSAPSTSNASTTCGASLNSLQALATTQLYLGAGYVATAGTSGTVQLQFAQNTSNATPSTIESNSYLLAFKVSGADLAEVYYSKEMGLMPGTVVSLDSSLKSGVQRSQKAYDPQVIGIVSTKPGMVIGDANGGGGSPVFVALSGRVPVLVTAENGPIQPGDFLTPSSTPGRAMKATKGSAIIGQAMTGHDGPEEGILITFIQTGFTQGGSLIDLMGGDVADYDQTIGKSALEYLAQNKVAVADAASTTEVLTDRLTAGLEVITPHLTAEEVLLTRGLSVENGDQSVFNVDEQGNVTIAGTLTAKTIVTEAVYSTSSLQNDIATISAGLVALAQPSGSVAGISTDENNQTLFSRATVFLEDVIFQKKVSFASAPEFNADTGGFAKIKKGSTQVAVTFENEFTELPIVRATPYETELFHLDQLTTKGFLIKLEQALETDMLFSWSAIAVPQAQTAQSPPADPSNSTILQ